MKAEGKQGQQQIKVESHKECRRTLAAEGAFDPGRKCLQVHQDCSRDADTLHVKKMEVGDSVRSRGERQKKERKREREIDRGEREERERERERKEREREREREKREIDRERKKEREREREIERVQDHVWDEERNENTK